MKIISCVDKRMGMAFNGRRQSSDRLVCEKIAELLAGQTLYMSPKSLHLFSDYSATVVSDTFLTDVGSGACCFVETDELPPIEEVDEVYLFHWNRSYPGDLFFTYDLKKNGFKCKKKEDFPGFSHEKITLEIYERV